MRYRRVLPLATLACCLLGATSSPADTVALGGSPLDVHVGERGELQALRLDSSEGTIGIFFAPLAPYGDAGFFLAFPDPSPAELAGTVYGFIGTAGPLFLSPYTPLSQGAVTGTGSGADPLAQVTSYSVRPAATDLVTVTQTTSYVSGSQEFRIKWSVANETGGALAFKALAAADFYFDGSDRGTGIFTLGPPRFVGGTNADTGNSGGFVEVLAGGSPPWSAYQSLAFGGADDEVWGKVQNAAASTTAVFDDSVVGEPVDDAGGVEWDQYVTSPLAAGATAEFELIVRSAVPSLLQIVPSSAGAPRGVPIDFSVTAVDTAGVPFAGKSLRFQIIGANAGSGSVTLGAAGTGTITDAGTNAGEDTIVTYVDFNENDTREEVEPQASALATFVDEVEPTCTVKVTGDRPGGGGAGKPLVITVVCDETTTVTATTTLAPARAPRRSGQGERRRKKVITLEATSATVGPGEEVPIDIVIPKAVARKYSGKTLRATVTIVASDPSGNAMQTTAERVIKLAKFRKKP